MDAKEVKARIGAHRLLLIAIMSSMEHASLGRGYFEKLMNSFIDAAFEGVTDEEEKEFARREIERVLKALRR